MSDANIDLASLRAELESIPEEELVQQLLELRTKQIANQRKNYNPEKAKAYHAKRNARNKALVQLAKDKGLYDSINARAKMKADVADGGDEEGDEEDAA